MAVSDQIRSITYSGVIMLITGLFPAGPGLSKFTVIARTTPIPKYLGSISCPSGFRTLVSAFGQDAQPGGRYCLLGKQEGA
jgi:hypothetical protein